MPLLDTQAAVWLLDDSRRLGIRARRLILDSRETFVSAASAWELMIKSMLGKLTVPGDLLGLVAAQGLSWLPVTAEHALAIERFPELTRHDPFDRLLVAQAWIDGLRLVTADRVLLAAGLDFVVDARE